jgi:uncharacterized protein (TIGR00725 family)
MDAEPSYKIAVLGSSAEAEDSPVGLKAFQVGRAIAVRGAALMTGGCPGLPHAAARGAMAAGGLTVAVSPATNRDEHLSVYGYPEDSKIMIYTGMGKAGRNVILIRSCDAGIFIGGGIGTLNELTNAFAELGPRGAIGLLLDSGGIVDEVTKIIALVGKPPSARLIREAHPDILAELVLTHIRRPQQPR